MRGGGGVKGKEAGPPRGEGRPGKWPPGGGCGHGPEEGAGGGGSKRG